MSFEIEYQNFLTPAFNDAFKQVYTNRQLGVKASYDVRKIAEAVDSIGKEFQTKREELVAKVKELDTEKAEETFKKEMSEFGAKKLTIEGKKISLRSIEHVALSGFDLDILEPILNDDVLRAVD